MFFKFKMNKKKHSSMWCCFLFFVLSFLFCFWWKNAFSFLVFWCSSTFLSLLPHHTNPTWIKLPFFLLNEVQHCILRLFKRFVITFFFQGSFHWGMFLSFCVKNVVGKCFWQVKQFVLRCLDVTEFPGSFSSITQCHFSSKASP